MNTQRPKIGNRAKSRQSVHNRPYYEKFRRQYQTKLIRRRARRLRGIENAKVKAKHPSDFRRADRRKAWKAFCIQRPCRWKHYAQAN